MADLLSCVDRFPAARILVVGDVMVDRYIWGKVSRISPEAPVPVVEVNEETTKPGGAANVFNNIRALDGRAELCGVIGSDPAGHWLVGEVERCQASPLGLVVDTACPTIEKTRIIAHSQQVVRFDREKRQSISQQTQQKIFEFVRSRLESSSEKWHCLVLSDYAKGVLTAGLTKDLLNLAKKQRIRVVVDPKVRHMDHYREVTLVTPNHLEASEATGVEILDQASLLEAGRRLLERLQCESVLITRGERGMSLFERTGEVTHIPAVARKVFDVTGAGDTVIGTLALSLAAGASLKEAAVLANHAAGIVVGIVGTATASRQELREAVQG